MFLQKTYFLMRPVNVKNSKFANLALKTLIKNQRFDSINYLPSIRVQKSNKDESAL